MQWLDDLDDLALAMVQVVERLHWPCLKIGFGAACTLLIVSSAEAIGVWIPALMGIAVGSLVLWAAGIGVRERRPTTSPRPSVSPNA